MQVVLRLEPHTYDEDLAFGVAQAFCNFEGFWNAVSAYRAGDDPDRLATSLLWAERRGHDIITRYIVIAARELERLEPGRGEPWRPYRPEVIEEPSEGAEIRQRAAFVVENLGHVRVWNVARPPATNRKRALRFSQKSEAVRSLELALRGKCLAPSCEADVAATDQVYSRRLRAASRPYLCLKHHTDSNDWSPLRRRVRAVLNEAAAIALRDN